MRSPWKPEPDRPHVQREPALKILLLNPNTTAEITSMMLEVGSAACSPGTTLVPATACRGVPYIASRAEAQIGGAVVLEMLAERHREIDAAIIAAFGDPGLLAARELFDIPIVGMAEAAMLTACMLGRRFTIVTFSHALGAWYDECVAMHGLKDRCSGVHMLGDAFSSVTTVQEELEERIVELANQAIRQDDADVLIFAGAPLSGFAARVGDRIGVPVVDQVVAAVKQAECLLALRPRKAVAGTFRRPGPKQTTQLPDALARRIQHID